MTLPSVFLMRSAQVTRVYQLLESHGPATAWAALEASGNVACFPRSVVELLRRHMMTNLASPSNIIHSHGHLHEATSQNEPKSGMLVELIQAPSIR